MSSIKNLWQNFADKHPGASKWVREGGLFVIVSNLITVFKYLMLLFLPLAFAGLPNIDFGFPGIDITLFGETLDVYKRQDRYRLLLNSIVMGEIMHMTAAKQRENLVIRQDLLLRQFMTK